MTQSPLAAVCARIYAIERDERWRGSPFASNPIVPSTVGYSWLGSTACALSASLRPVARALLEATIRSAWRITCARVCGKFV